MTDAHVEAAAQPPLTPLLADEFVLDEYDELLWRMVSPAHLTSNGEPSGEAFADEARQLSHVRSSKYSAAEAYDHHTAAPDRKSAGVWATTPADARDIQVGTAMVTCRVVDDDACAHNVTPGHAYIDLRDVQDTGGLSAKRVRKVIRNTLAAAAEFRGRQHPTT